MPHGRNKCLAAHAEFRDWELEACVKTFSTDCLDLGKSGQISFVYRQSRPLLGHKALSIVRRFLVPD